MFVDYIISSNHQYLQHLLYDNSPDPIAISEHWLQDNNIQKIQELHSDNRFLAVCPPCQEHPLFCTPQLLSGHGGVYNHRMEFPTRPPHQTDSHCVLPPNVRNWLFPAPVFVFSVYLPSRSGYTDVFTETLDQLNAVLGQAQLNNFCCGMHVLVGMAYSAS